MIIKCFYQLFNMIYLAYFKVEKTLEEQIEEERRSQISIMQSIYISIQNSSYKKKAKLESLPKTKNLDQLILAHTRVLELNALIREKGTKRMEARQRKQICMQYYTTSKCRYEECCYAHIVGDQFAKEYYCKNAKYCNNLRCVFQHNKDESDEVSDMNSETICGICHDDVQDTNRRYGLLQNCSHIFCLNCIKTYRSGRYNSSITLPDRLKCPMCRKPSRYVLPSKYNLDGEHKIKSFAQFCQKRKEKQCMYGTMCSRINTCPFKH